MTLERLLKTIGGFMKTKFYFIFLLFLFLFPILHSNDVAGSISGAPEMAVHKKDIFPLGKYKMPNIVTNSRDDIYTTTTFTFTDIVV